MTGLAADDLALGLETTPNWTLGVLLSRSGGVVARFDPTDTLAEAVAAARGRGGAITHAAIASAEPDGDSAALDALRGALPSARVPSEPVRTGIALALGESQFGIARGARHVVAFAVGDHPVAGLLLDGRIWTGAHGFAGDVAWLALNPVEREDYRRIGCLEAEAGPGGIVRRLVWRVKSGDESLVADRAAGDFSKIGVEDVLRGARDGDGVATAVVRDTVKYLGMTIANLACTVDPDLVVLGGLMESEADLLLDPLRQECARHLPPALGAQLRIEASQLGPYGPALGAAAHALSAT
jgi:glucokinase